MVRIAKKSDPKKLDELKKKIKDAQYVDEAIRKLAQRLSSEIIQSRQG
ncbi:MAG: hypothetical protein ACOC0Y_01400 [Spirochaetota bacterium]